MEPGWVQQDRNLKRQSQSGIVNIYVDDNGHLIIVSGDGTETEKRTCQDSPGGG